VSPKTLVLTIGGLLLIPICAAPQGPSLPPTAETATKIRTGLAEGIGATVKSTSVRSFLDAQALAQSLNAYLDSRAGVSLSPSTLLRLAQAEWSARQAGRGTVPASSLASVATRAFVDDLQGATAPLPANGIGLPYFVITEEKLNAVRLHYRIYSPDATGSALPENPGDLGPGSALVSVQKAYPVEAILALYSCISEDLGLGPSALAERWQVTRGRPASSCIRTRHPFGDDGWMTRRPVSKLLTDKLINQILDLAS
jgi:hypothetical protein